jgi:L-seryl-tRNA(Ser) seleniumtransferase
MPVIGSLVPASLSMAAPAKRDYFKELGVGTFINAAGTYTTLTASLMRPEVVAAIEYASKSFVRLNELHDAVGKRIAELLECEAAMVSSGAAAALTCGTAACVAGANQEFIRRLPNLEGMKDEVIVQKTHRYGYDHAVRNVGIKFVEVGSAEEMERAINSKTAMMLFFNAADKTPVPAEQFIAIGKRHNVPTMNDAAADTPPTGVLKELTKLGFDLVIFSGGKGIRGPQSAGLLLGRKDLIEGARLNTSPFSDSIGRGLKVNKEELLGMMVAVETFVKRDAETEAREWDKRCKQIMDSVNSVKGVNTEVKTPKISNRVPHVHITWDQSRVKITPGEAVKALREGTPSIEVTPGSSDRLTVSVWMLQQGEAEIVAKRIREVLKSAS